MSNSAFLEYRAYTLDEFQDVYGSVDPCPDGPAQGHLMNDVEVVSTVLVPAKASQVKRWRRFVKILAFWSVFACSPAIYVTWWSV